VGSYQRVILITGVYMQNITIDYKKESFLKSTDIFRVHSAEYHQQNFIKKLIEGEEFTLVRRGAINSRARLDQDYGYENLFKLLGLDNCSSHKYFPYLQKNKVFSDSDCNELINIMRRDTYSHTEDNIVYPSLSVGMDKNIIKYMVRNVINAFDGELSGYFNTKYIPIHVSAWRTQGMHEDLASKNYSYKWHVDNAPSNYLKVLLYLNDYEEGGGTTELYGYEQCKVSEEIGYSMCPLISRKTDLRGFFKCYGLDPDPVRLEPNKGSAILFDPTFTLHKGVAPREGRERFAIQISFIPFPASYFEIEDTILNLLSTSKGLSYPTIKMSDEISSQLAG